ncbi:chemotaxis protein MotC [Arvimicrobium flavum]|uniref:chemotaxis protein MotC n=1 Tax=Arvimicrobium flavum TaxID=3393320 RepID=UPI00237B9D43|nr:chemotaxis protein MotC [Mesorhizobium shangrilense]
MRVAAAWIIAPVIAFHGGMATAVAQEQSSLQPYQMVRSLQSLQDRIATGDHAALPMQNKLLQLIDGRLRAASDDDFGEARNVRAALIYGMSGGNPLTLAAVLRRTPISQEDKILGAGVLAYLNGNPNGAQSALSDVDPSAMPAEIGAFFALVKGAVSSAADHATALRHFDTARLLGPGTLVEEAALRRSLAIHASLGQADRFFLAATQYVHRFLRSPYASQFADSFVTGILILHASLDYQAIDDITAMMDADQRKVIYLRLARRAAIEGLVELSAFASARADGASEPGLRDPRSQLYSSLSTLTSENIEDVAAKLKSIDRKKLADSDIRLLEAAESVVTEVTARPSLNASSFIAEPAAAPDERRAAPAPAPQVDAAQTSPAAGTDVAPTAPGPAAAMVTATRAKLSEIDKMLEGAK